jgi:deoxyadenosine/deoxycytidine kinase
MKKFIAVAGNIGAGKSTLVEKICEKFNWEPYFEPVAENPYLENFYEDMGKWAFHSQLYFLSNRIRSHKELLLHPTSVVQDRSIYEDAQIFAQNLYNQGLISDRDFRTYQEFYQLLITLLNPPDLVVYLNASVDTLQDRINRRGRDIENAIPREYLMQLNELYETWIDTFSLCPVLTIPADEIDFITHPRQLELIVDKIMAKLKGEKEVSFSSKDIKYYQ